MGGQKAFHAQIERGGSRSEFKNHSLEITVGMPCSSCNGGWMRALENQVMPFVATMAYRGDKTLLDADRQLALTRWVVKTAKGFEPYVWVVDLDEGTVRRRSPEEHGGPDRLLRRRRRESLRCGEVSVSGRERDQARDFEDSRRLPHCGGRRERRAELFRSLAVVRVPLHTVTA
jgi:hypothetical protein